MTKRQTFGTAEERYYLGWSTSQEHTRDWQRRTVIFHYSNGTNKCCIEGCDAPIDVLTLEHEDFDRDEMNKTLGICNNTGAAMLVSRLLFLKLPDVNLTVKCMLHNSLNISPKQGRPRTRVIDAKQSEYRSSYVIRQKQLAYSIYGYTGDTKGMTWEHSNNDGNIHREYLRVKYGWKMPPGGFSFDQLMIREYKAGVPNWPGLIIADANVNHMGRKSYLKTKDK